MDTALTHRGGIIGLAEIAVDTARAGGVDDAAVSLAHKMWPHGFGHAIGAFEVDVHNGTPKGVVHVGERLVANESGIIDQYVDAPEDVERLLYDVLALFDRCSDSTGFTALAADLVHNSPRVCPVNDDY